jgi:hypothetical protein
MSTRNAASSLKVREQSQLMMNPQVNDALVESSEQLITAPLGTPKA